MKGKFFRRINSIIITYDEKDGTYYIYGSHMTAAKSTDLLNWETIADGYMKTNPVYGQIYDVADDAFNYAGSKDSIIKTDDGGTHVWAPDVIYNKTTSQIFLHQQIFPKIKPIQVYLLLKFQRILTLI